jgi:hypothetical protein
MLAHFLLFFFVIFLASTPEDGGHDALVFAAAIDIAVRNLVAREPPQFLDHCDYLFEGFLPIVFLPSELGFWIDIFVDLLSKSSLFCLQTLNNLKENFLGDDLVSGLESDGRDLKELLRIFIVAIKQHKFVYGALLIVFKRVTAVSSDVLDSHGV